MSQYPWLLLAVYVGVVGTVQLLALWATTSTRPWLLRALVVWTPIAILLPIRAYSPALFLTLSATWTILLEFGLQEVDRRRTKEAVPRRRQFRLADLLVAVLLVATLLGTSTQLVERQHLLTAIFGVSVVALPIAIVTQLAYRAVVGPYRGMMVLLLVVVIWILTLILVAVRTPLYLDVGPTSLGGGQSVLSPESMALRGAIPLLLAVCLAVPLVVAKLSGNMPAGRRPWAMLVATGLALAVGVPVVILAWDEFWSTSRKFLLLRTAEFGIRAIPLLALSGFVALISWLSSIARIQTTSFRRHLACGALLLLALVAVLPGTWLYWQMLWYAPFPEVEVGSVNHYERLVGIAKTLNGYTNRGPLPAPIAAELDEAVVMLRESNPPPPHILEMNATRNEKELTGYDLRAINGRLREAAEAAETRGEFDRAADYAMAMIRYDAMAGLGDSAGFAPDGYRFLAEYRGKVSAKQARDLIGLLRQTISERRDLDTVVAVQIAQWERRGGWSVKLGSILARVTASHSLDTASEAMAASVKERRKLIEAWNVLLQADLAIRVFQVENGRLPKDLHELTDSILSGVPLDPFSGRPLVYLASGNDFLLYSVGLDGTDDGGTFVGRPRAPLERFDVRLEPLPAK